MFERSTFVILRYSSEMSDRVYATAAERARVAVREGHSAIVDAVFMRPDHRRAIEGVAADMSLPFIGIWLEARESILIARTEERRNDPSDADADVIRLQHRQQTGVMTWHRVDASGSSQIVLDSAMKHVQGHMRGGNNTPPADAGASPSSLHG
jgi:uncharacterized protein